MDGLKTMHDIRSMRTLITRAMPAGDGAVFLQLHRLASEKLRLEREADHWQRRKERIEKRLSEIEHQMETLHGLRPAVTVESRVDNPRRNWREVTLEY